MYCSAKGIAAAARWGFKLLCCAAILGAAAQDSSPVREFSPRSDLISQHDLISQRDLLPQRGLLTTGGQFGFEAVLVSFSMPERSLRKLAEDAARAGVPLYLNGLVNGGMRATAKRIKKVDPSGKARWSIDPRLFDKLGIRAVPVLAIDNGDGFAVLAGDVRLSYSLERIAGRGGRAGDRARELLASMGSAR